MSTPSNLPKAVVSINEAATDLSVKLIHLTAAVADLLEQTTRAVEHDEPKHEVLNMLQTLGWGMSDLEAAHKDAMDVITAQFAALQTLIDQRDQALLDLKEAQEAVDAAQYDVEEAYMQGYDAAISGAGEYLPSEDAYEEGYEQGYTVATDDVQAEIDRLQAAYEGAEQALAEARTQLNSYIGVLSVEEWEVVKARLDEQGIEVGV